MLEQPLKRVLLTGNTECSGKNTIARLFKDYDECIYYKYYKYYIYKGNTEIHHILLLVQLFKYCKNNNKSVALFKHYNYSVSYDFNIHIIRNMLVSNFVNIIQTEIEGCDYFTVHKEIPEKAFVIYHKDLMLTPNDCLKQLSSYLNIEYRYLNVTSIFLKKYNKYLTIKEKRSLFVNYNIDELEEKYMLLHSKLSKIFNYDFIPFNDVMKK